MSYSEPLHEMRRIMTGEDSNYPEGGARHKYQNADGDVCTQLQVMCAQLLSSLFLLPTFFPCRSFLILASSFPSSHLASSFPSSYLVSPYLILYLILRTTLFVSLTSFRTIPKMTLLTLAAVITRMKIMLEFTRALKRMEGPRQAGSLPLPLLLHLFCSRHRMERELSERNLIPDLLHPFPPPFIHYQQEEKGMKVCRILLSHNSVCWRSRMKTPKFLFHPLFLFFFSSSLSGRKAAKKAVNSGETQIVIL